jgi:predicted proteasome-type protease
MVTWDYTVATCANLLHHNYSGGEVQIPPNLQVLTGEAKYGEPVIERVLEVE